MEIIKTGHLELFTNGKKYKAICPKCGCEFTFNEQECSSDQREGDTWVHCPICQNCISITSHHVEQISQEIRTVRGKTDLFAPFQPYFKVGETVYMAYDPTVKGIVEDVPEDPTSHYYVRTEGK